MRTRRPAPLAAAALVLSLASCAPPERGFNDATLTGAVRVEPALRDEKSGENGTAADAQQNVPLVSHGRVVISGSIDEFGERVGEETLEGDVDWYELGAEAEAEVPITVQMRELAPGTGLRVGLYEPGGTLTPPQVIAEVDAVAGADGSIGVELSQAMVPGEIVLLRIAGLRGAGSAPYEVILEGQHPDEAGILVGAYASEDLSVRRPIAGAAVGGFEVQEDHAYVGHYTMMLARVVETRPHPFTELFSEEDLANLGVDPDRTFTFVDETPGSVFVFAGDWPLLTGGLPAGTWYTSEPAITGVPEEGTAEVAPVVLDAFAPLVIGVEVDETEPNDLEIRDDFTLNLASGTAQDVGGLTGLGFVDVFRGTIELGEGEGFVHDVDVFAFTVPEPMTLQLNLGWDSDADIDIIVYDEAGEVTDAAASLANPELGGGEWVYETELQYYLVVAGYAGEAGSAPAYELRVEPGSP